MIKKAKTVNEKNNDLQNNICHKVDPSKDFTINPPKLKLQAPKKISNGPGNLDIKVIKFDLINYQFPFYIAYAFFQLPVILLI